MGLNAKEERVFFGGGGENLAGCGLSMLEREVCCVVERSVGYVVERNQVCCRVAWEVVGVVEYAVMSQGE